MNILFIVKVGVHVLIKWSYRSSSLYGLFKPRVIDRIFEHACWITYTLLPWYPYSLERYQPNS
jgi:hypothetical protein